jgi:hypothetical protein
VEKVGNEKAKDEFHEELLVGSTIEVIQSGKRMEELTIMATRNDTQVFPMLLPFRL